MFRCSVLHSPDGLRGVVKVSFGGDSTYPTIEELRLLLRQRGIVHGVDEQALAELVRDRLYDIGTVVAHGTPPVPGVPGRLEYLVDLSGAGKPRERADGSVDHRDLRFAINVRKGQGLVKRIPPVPGEEGTDVFGRPIKVAVPPDVRIRAGKGTAVSEENPEILVAAIDGAVTCSHDGIVEVRNDRVVPGDVDYSTGSVRFSGDLLVHGTVRGGFDVRAEGDVTIGGSVEDSTVTSAGDITVLGGASGAGKGLLAAGNSITVRRLENFSAEAGADLAVTEDIIQCRVTAGGMVTARSIVGGEVRSGKGVEVESLGNGAEIKTVVSLEGRFLMVKERDAALRSLTGQVKEVAQSREALFAFARDGMDAAGKLTPLQEDRLGELKSAKRQCEAQAQNLQKRIEEIDASLSTMAVPKIRAQTIFPNTIIRCGNLEKFIRETLTNTTIVMGQDRIAFSNQ